MQLRMYGATDRGLVRSSNQDSLFFSEDYGIVIVSDGMGGHKGGEIASSLSVNGLKDAFLASTQILIENVGSFLDEVLKNINAEILRRAAEDKNLRGMGATVNYLQFAGGRVAIGHAGDSRTYLARMVRTPANEAVCGFWQLTVDHNVGTFVERGLLNIGASQGPLSERQKSRLMRGMGVTSDLKADLYMRNMHDGDVYVTCSDGLHGYVTDQEIVHALCSGKLEDAPDRLIELAKSVGAPDNVTVVVSAWSEAEEPLLKYEFESLDAAPYLVRLPSGHVVGPYDADKIIRKWLQGEVPFDAEISGRGSRWVFLRHSKELLIVYPEFDRPDVRQHFSRMIPASMVEASKKSKATVRVVVSRPKWHMWLLGAVLLGGGLTLFALVVLEYISLQNTAY